MAKKPPAGNDLQELKQALKSKNLGRLYVFHGEETFLLHHYLEQMKKQLLDALTEEFNYHRLNSESFDIQTFADAVENLPMMAESTLVQVDDIDLLKLGEGERNKMAEILSDIPDYCTVVFTYITTPWKPDKRLNCVENYKHMLRLCEQYRIPIVVNSDAHDPSYVGRFDEAIALLQELKFDPELILNTSVERFLKFIGRLEDK